MNYRQLQRELNNRIIAPAYLFVSEDKYIADSYIRLIKQRVVSGQLEEVNTNTFSNKLISASDVKNALESLPIMNERRFVLVELDDISAEASLCNMLVKYLEDTCETSVMIVSTKKCDKRTKIYKAFASNAKIVVFEKLKDKELYEWIEGAFLKRGRKISKEAIEYMIDAVDYNAREGAADLGYFENEIQKIIAFVPEANQISIEDAKKTVSVNITKDIFKYTECVLTGRLSEAFVRMGELTNSKVPIQMILASLNKTLKMNAIFKYLANNGYSEAQIISRTKAHPYSVKVALSKYLMDYNSSLSAIKALSDTDVSIKRGIIEPNTAIVLLTEKICSLAKSI